VDIAVDAGDERHGEDRLNYFILLDLFIPPASRVTTHRSFRNDDLLRLSSLLRKEVDIRRVTDFVFIEQKVISLATSLLR